MQMRNIYEPVTYLHNYVIGTTNGGGAIINKILNFPPKWLIINFLLCFHCQQLPAGAKNETVTRKVVEQKTKNNCLKDARMICAANKFMRLRVNIDHSCTTGSTGTTGFHVESYFGVFSHDVIFTRNVLQQYK